MREYRKFSAWECVKIAFLVLAAVCIAVWTR